MEVRAGSRAAARAHAHALGVVPAAGRVTGRGARAARYAAPRLTRAARAAPPARVRPGGSQREHRSLRACRLPRIFVLTSRTGTVKLCSFASVRRGLTGCRGGFALLHFSCRVLT